MQSGFDGKYWTCSIRKDSVCLVIICHGDLLPWRCCDITIILFHHGVDSLPFLTTSPQFNRLSQNGSNDYNETSTEWSDSSLRNEKTIKKNFFLNKENTTRTWPKIQQTARLLLIPLRNPAGWYPWSLDIPIGILSLFTFLFFFYLIQYTILWIRISSMTWDTRGQSRPSYALWDFLLIFSFLFLHCPDIESEI